MEFIDERTIRLDRIPSELDRFVLDFIKILGKHTDYVIVSGYVAILFGRTRTTEDVDIIMPEMQEERFSAFFRESIKHGLWFINSSLESDLFGLLKSGSAIRAAEDGMIAPNIEIKFARKRLDSESLKNKVKVLFAGQEMFISRLEPQIAYKEKILASDKDMEDARHLRTVFAENLNKELLDYYLVNIEDVYEQG